MELANIPQDTINDYKEFLSMLDMDIPDSDKEIFRGTIDKIKSMHPNIDSLINSEKEVIEPISSFDESFEDVEVIENDLLSNGNWYKENPDKLLGNVVLDKDMRGNEIKVLKGDISVLSKIIASDDFAQFEKELITSVSVISKSINEKVSAKEDKTFIESVIQESNKDIGRKLVKKVKEKDENLLTNDNPIEPEVRSFYEVSNELNENISLEEMRCYFWYKQNIGQPLSQEWADLTKQSEDNRTESEKIKAWVEDGILFYINGKYEPLPIYLSGNIYEKAGRIIKTSENNGFDVDFIKSTYGQKVLDKQIQLINESFKRVYNKRLVITGNEDENSLILKPISSFAKTFMISETNSMEEFKWNISKRAKDKGEIDFYSNNTSTWKMRVIDELSLTNAFVLWMVKNANKISFNGNIYWNDILYYYIEGRYKTCGKCSPEETQRFKENQTRIKANAQSEGDRLFLQFLKEELTLNQKVQVESQWNSTLNNYLAPDFTKIPVAFNVTENLGNEMPFKIKWEKREAVAFLFNEGSGCLAYDVGVGKTMSAIMTTEQFLVAGYCKRPFVVVPNQTFRQWLSEIKNILPHRKINALYNLGEGYEQEVMDEFGEVQMVDDGSISVLTYEGFLKLGFNETTQSTLMTELYDILNQGGASELSQKKTASFYEKLEGLIGKGLKGTLIEIESLGFDYVCFDEAHAMKKVFTTVKSREEEEGSTKRGKSQYSIQSGTPSSTALKGFMISNYILQNNNFRNVILLTATPFTNSPLEVFSMLSLVGYRHIELLGLKNINDFFDNFIDVKTELTVNHKLKPEFKQVIKGFNNLPSLQRIVLRFFNYKDGEDVGVVRPNKIVLPYTKKLVNGEVVNLPKDEEVTCNIPMSIEQQTYMNEVIAYVEGKVSSLANLTDGIDMEEFESSEDDVVDMESYEIDETGLTDKESSGVIALKGMNYARNIALSPYLYEFHRLGEPTYKSYVEKSPKIKYVIECIKSVINYHKKNNEPISGQVIYMDRGLKYFSLIEEYLIKEVGLKSHEVGQITSKMSQDKKREMQDSFLGVRFNQKTLEYENITDDQRIKVLIGSSSIKEGMNLQKKSTMLYNCFIDWNPTDVLQLQGRIWRQKNEYKYVRIVNPLLIDSMDIFMFQKLEEKTARINSIWSNDGRSVMKLEELDTEEIKMSLIKDPKVIAEFESKIKATKLEDKQNSIKVINDRLVEYKKAYENLFYYRDKINAEFDLYANENQIGLSTLDRTKWLIKFFNQKTLKDKEGRVMLDYFERNMSELEFLEKYPKQQRSSKDKPSKPYWLTYASEYLRLINKEDKDLLNPRGITLENIDEIIKSHELEIEDIKNEITFLRSENYVNDRVSQIMIERERNQFEIKSIPQLIREFERQNHLLSEKIITSSPKPKKMSIKEMEDFTCELVDKNGVRKIDAESIKKLTKCIDKLPQTKDLHTDESGQYTEERKKLHDKIIKKFKMNVACVQQDEPIAILTGGSPASGKSTFLEKYAPFLLSDKIFKVDADEVRASLPEYKGWNASATHSETKDIVNTLISNREVGMPCLHDLIYDGTMNNTKNYLPLINMLKNLGYKIYIVYMDNIPYDVVKKRMLKRYKESGRFVPIEVIDDFYSKGKDALNELKTKVDGYMVVDAMSDGYDIIEQGGEDLPQSRGYFSNGNKKRETSKTEDLTKVIRGLKVLLKTSSTKEKQELEKVIRGLELINK